MRRLIPDGYVKWRNVIATLVAEQARPRVVVVVAVVTAG
jgi:hypothetical protein